MNGRVSPRGRLLSNQLGPVASLSRVSLGFRVYGLGF